MRISLETRIKVRYLRPMTDKDQLDPVILRMRELVERLGERVVLKALMDTPIDLSLAERIVTGRYNARPKGTNRNILEAFLKEQEKAS